MVSPEKSYFRNQMTGGQETTGERKMPTLMEMPENEEWNYAFYAVMKEDSPEVEYLARYRAGEALNDQEVLDLNKKAARIKEIKRQTDLLHERVISGGLVDEISEVNPYLKQLKTIASLDNSDVMTREDLAQFCQQDPQFFNEMTQKLGYFDYFKETEVKPIEKGWLNKVKKVAEKLKLDPKKIDKILAMSTETPEEQQLFAAEMAKYIHEQGRFTWAAGQWGDNKKEVLLQEILSLKEEMKKAFDASAPGFRPGVHYMSRLSDMGDKLIDKRTKEDISKRANERQLGKKEGKQMGYKELTAFFNLAPDKEKTVEAEYGRYGTIMKNLAAENLGREDDLDSITNGDIDAYLSTPANFQEARKRIRSNLEASAGKGFYAWILDQVFMKKF